MSEFEDLVERYIAAWNEADAGRRRGMIAETFTEAASYVDPLAASEGHAGIDAMIEAVRQQFPGHRFRRTGAVDRHHDRVRFCWELAADGNAVVAKGADFATVSGGRFAAVTGFIDRAPGSA